ncbi:aldehyde dehydrogenase family protein, partial [Roseobacter weihaiensis]|uniref:aldehyde dehydrogenase family protein n=1 Tax=Roseobacter weihaiensis TaxID=2763262 RepID=UPI003873B440
MRLIEIIADLLPPRVLNMVAGCGEEAGAVLASHPDIDKVTFTGSTATARAIMSAATDRILPVSLEFGGNSLCIVFEDADHDWAVQGALDAMRFTSLAEVCRKAGIAEATFYNWRKKYAGLMPNAGCRPSYGRIEP